MGIGSIARIAFNYVKARPLKSAVIGSALALGTGLVLHKASTTSQNEAQQQVDRMILSDPFKNPFGWFNHAVHPENAKPTNCDNPVVRYIINNRVQNENSRAENQENLGKTVRYA
jgi:hypothetical protein